MKAFRALDYTNHILDAAKLAHSYIANMSRDEFERDLRTQQAVTMNFVIMGEATTNILQKYPAFATQNSNIPWSKIKGMRNRLAHGYYDLDLDTVWQTVNNELPTLISQLEAIEEFGS